MQIKAVLKFWFEELDRKQHFVKDDQVDTAIRERFGALHQQAVDEQLEPWRGSAEGRLAEIIILDQFSRNLYRGDARAWTADPLALRLAREAVASGDDMKLPAEQRFFLYMPYMHSESAQAHEEAVALFEQLGNKDALKYEILHKAIIDEFGRYPYQNELLGRQSTAEEVEYLKNNKGF